MKINGVEYPREKEFQEETGLERTTLWRLRNKHPEIAFKFCNQIYYDRQEFAKIFLRTRGKKLHD